jgi:hypothetical protein
MLERAFSNPQLASRFGGCGNSVLVSGGGKHCRRFEWIGMAYASARMPWWIFWSTEWIHDTSWRINDLHSYLNGPTEPLSALH